eukprot:259629-Pyramimonas_sp.AAC.1
MHTVEPIRHNQRGSAEEMPNTESDSVPGLLECTGVEIEQEGGEHEINNEEEIPELCIAIVEGAE